MIQAVIPTERSDWRNLLFRRKTRLTTRFVNRCRGRCWQLRGGYSLSLSAHLKPRCSEFRLRERKAVLCETLARYLPLLGGAETAYLSMIGKRSGATTWFNQKLETAIPISTLKHMPATPHPEPSYCHPPRKKLLRRHIHHTAVRHHKYALTTLRRHGVRASEFSERRQNRDLFAKPKTR
jgi:hypothetical protein